MDVVSEVMKVFKVDGAVVNSAEFSPPWSFRVTSPHVLVPNSGTNKDHIIIFHLVLEGSAQIRGEKDENILLEAGDVVVFPHGEPHLVENAWRTANFESEDEVPQSLFARGPDLFNRRAGGDVAKLVSVSMVCDPRLNNGLLRGLPNIFKVSIRDGARGRWLEESIRFWVKEAGSSAPCEKLVIARLSEAFFFEILRRYLALLSPDEKHLLAGSRDPDIGKILVLMHSRPAHGWTISDLARNVGTSRSALIRRFTQFLGRSPMSYLTYWRLNLAAKLLESTNSGVQQIAFEVGYESESAFNRAFKRQFGLPPARYRLAMRVRQQ